MKILLDNCVPYRAKRLFPGHDAKHTSDAGFENLSNGELIARAASDFEVIVTTDKNIRFEHNLAKLPIAIVELNTKFTRMQDLQVLQPHLEAALDAAKKHRFVSVDASGNLELLPRA